MQEYKGIFVRRNYQDTCLPIETQLRARVPACTSDFLRHHALSVGFVSVGFVLHPPGCGDLPAWDHPWCSGIAQHSRIVQHCYRAQGSRQVPTTAAHCGQHAKKGHGKNQLFLGEEVHNTRERTPPSSPIAGANPWLFHAHCASSPPMPAEASSTWRAISYGPCWLKTFSPKQKCLVPVYIYLFVSCSTRILLEFPSLRQFFPHLPGTIWAQSRVPEAH